MSEEIITQPPDVNARGLCVYKHDTREMSHLKPQPDLTSRIWRMDVQGHSIICIDYSGCREHEMIALGTLATNYLLACTTPQLTLTNYRNTFTTPAYVRHMESKAVLVKHLIARNALVGLNTAKIMILKGFNLLMGTDFRPFSTEAEALQYLVGEELAAPLTPIFFGEHVSSEGAA